MTPRCPHTSPRLFDAGKAPAVAALVIAAANFRARVNGKPSPAGVMTERTMAGYRRKGAGRGRGQAAPLTSDGLASIIATASIPREGERYTETPGKPPPSEERKPPPLPRFFSKVVCAGVKLLRSRLGTWSHAPRVPRCGCGQDKTNATGKTSTSASSKTGPPVRFLLLRHARRRRAVAFHHVRPYHRAPLHRRRTSRRFACPPYPHSGRVGLASELTARGASTTETMLAGNWKTARMVAHYSARRACGTWSGRQVPLSFEP